MAAVKPRKPAIDFGKLALLLPFSSYLPGVARVASVTQLKPRFRPSSRTAGAVAAAGGLIESARREEKTDPLSALGDLLEATRAASEVLIQNPSDADALETYNFALARTFGILQNSDLCPWRAPVSIPKGGFVLTFKADPRPNWNPDLYRFVPCDQFGTRGSFVSERSIKEGIGAPLVAIGKDRNENFREEFTSPHAYYGVTGLLKFQGRNAELSIEDPLATETVELHEKKWPLAADFTVPLAAMLDGARLESMGLPRMLRPGKHAETARLSRLQPYDPRKTVVLLLHGLMDSPATWTPMINRLRADPVIRENFQFWLFSYPSGYPYPHAAAILRRELDRAGKIFPINKPMVVIGHSMGGCIARLLVTDSGDQLWTAIFQKPPAETELPESDRLVIQEALIFQRRQDIGRVIFISAPLRGTEFAENVLSRFGSLLIQTPSNLRQTVRSAVLAIGSHAGRRSNANAIETLAPAHLFVQTINTIPIHCDTPLHVVAGDQGKGGNKDGTAPAMSDGIVPYWSSHIDGAESELVVPSEHGAHQHPETMDEILRILRLHLQTEPPSTG